MADPSAIADTVVKVLEELDKIVPEVYHFLADPTKQSIGTYDSGDLVDEGKVKDSMVANVAAALGKSADEVKDHVHVTIEDGDTVKGNYSLNRKSNIKSPVHGTTTGYSVKIPLQLSITPTRISVNYDAGDGSEAIQSPVGHAIRKVHIAPGAGEIYLWMLRSADLKITADAQKSGGETSYEFDFGLSNLVGYFRPDMNESHDKVTVGADGSLSGASGNLEDA